MHTLDRTYNPVLLASDHEESDLREYRVDILSDEKEGLQKELVDTLNMVYLKEDCKASFGKFMTKEFDQDQFDLAMQQIAAYEFDPRSLKALKKSCATLSRDIKRGYRIEKGTLFAIVYPDKGKVGWYTKTGDLVEEGIHRGSYQSTFKQASNE